MSELAEWLTAIWDGDEERLTGPTFCGPVWPTTDQLLARIAADREILAMHDIAHDPCDAHDASFNSIPCDTVRMLALPHADRPGYREDWKPLMATPMGSAYGTGAPSYVERLEKL